MPRKTSSKLALSTLSFEDVFHLTYKSSDQEISNEDIYGLLRQCKYCNRIASYTDSMIQALSSAAQHNMEETLTFAIQAYKHPSRASDSRKRWEWMRETILANTKLDIGTPESHKLSPPFEHKKVYRN